MDYNQIECDTQGIPGCRFVLKKKGHNPLIVLGLNPSTADETKPDATMRKIMGFISRWNESGIHDFDSFIMVNLYPLRETFPRKLKDKDDYLHKVNLEVISSILKEYPSGSVLLCYGDSIELVKWMKDCRDDIFKLFGQYPDIKVYCLGESSDKCSLTRRRNPRHPSRLSYKNELKLFRIPDSSLNH